MATRCATPRLLTYEYPPVIHQQQSLLQAYPCHSIQGAAYVMMTADIESGLIRAYRGTHRVFEPSPCYYALPEKFSVEDLESGDRSAADSLAEYAAIARAVPWAAVLDRLPYHNVPTRQDLSTLLPDLVGTVADRWCPYIRIVGVSRSPRAPLGVMLAEPMLVDAVPRVLPVTEEAWAVPSGSPLPDSGDVPPSTEEAAASAAYRARKRRHADMELGGPVHPGSADTGSPADCSPGAPAGPAAFPAPGSPIAELVSHGPGGGEEEAHAWGSAGPGAGPSGGAASRSAANTDWDRYPAARDDGSGSAPDGRWAEERYDDYPGTAGADFGDGRPADADGGAVGARHDRGDRREGGVGRGTDAWDERAWPAASHDNGRSHDAAGRDGPMWRTDGGQGRGGDAPGGLQWGSEPRRDGGEYPTAGAGAAAGSQSGAQGGFHWGSKSRRDGGEYPADGVGTAAGSHRDTFGGRL